MRILAPLALALLVLPPALAAVDDPVPQDDAGTGHDAGDAPSQATPVLPGVVHQATFVSPPVHGAILFGDQDWYSFDAPAPARLDVRVDGVRACVHALDDAQARLGSACGFPDREGRVQVALPSAGRYLLWLGSSGTPVTQPYRFSFALDAAAPDPVRARLPSPPAAPASPQDDAGSGRDAGDSAADAVPIQPGVGYHARSGGLGDADWYSFEATEGQAIGVDAIGAYVCLALLGPDLAVAGSFCNAGYAVDEQGGGWVATATGTWYLRTSPVAPEPYAFGVSLDGSRPLVTAPPLA